MTSKKDNILLIRYSKRLFPPQDLLVLMPAVDRRTNLCRELLTWYKKLGPVKVMRRFLADIPLFVEVAKRKSFTRAANALEIPLPTVSRRIADLERELEVKLFNRNNRKVEVTEAGKGFYVRCENILAEAIQAKESVMQSQESISGRIRVSIAPTFYFICMQGALSAFTEKYPNIDMHVTLSLQTTDFEDYDLKVWSGPLPNSSLKVRKILDSQMGLYSTPAFFGHRLPPQKPKDLNNESIIQIKGFFEHSLELCRGKQKIRVPIKPKYIVNNMGLSVEFLMAGQGIAVLHKQLAEKFEQVGALIRILPEWSCLGFETYLLCPEGPTPRRIEVFLNHLAEHFQAIERFPQKLAKNIGGIMIECPLCSRCHKKGHSNLDEHARQCPPDCHKNQASNKI